MPPAPRHGLTDRVSRGTPLGIPGVPSPTCQDDASLEIILTTQLNGKETLLRMPDEIIANILIEWTMLEWFAPATARQICRRLKAITDSSPRVWSKLSLPYYSPATADDIREWLRRAKAAPKEILLESEDVFIVSAALEGAKDATSLIYRIPIFKDIPPPEQELIRIPTHMPQLRHLYLDASNIYDFMSRSNIFGPYEPPYNAHFPYLTVLHLDFVDLTGFHIMHGLFPAIRRLVLQAVHGPTLDLIQICSGSLQDLRVSWYRQQWPPHHLRH
jgi:hypothetical protein